MKVNNDLCLKCGSCIENCPVMAISINKKEGTIVIDENKCVQCEACKECCPRMSIQT